MAENCGRMVEKLVRNIRNICKEKGITITQLEKDLGFSPGLISRWNKSTKTSPAFDKIVDIIEYLGVTYDELMAENRENRSARTSAVNGGIGKVLVEASMSGKLSWTSGDEGIPFDMSFGDIFAEWNQYYVHRFYFAEFDYTVRQKGWFLLAVQYNDDTCEAVVDVFQLCGEGMEAERLQVSESDAMHILQYADRRLFRSMNSGRNEKMIDVFRREVG